PIILRAAEAERPAKNAAANRHTKSDGTFRAAASCREAAARLGETRAAGDPPLNLANDRGRRPLIGVDRQNPIAAGQIGRPVSLLGEGIEGMLDHAAAVAASNGQRVVGGTAIDDHDLADPIKPREQRGQMALLVERDDRGGYCWRRSHATISLGTDIPV